MNIGKKIMEIRKEHNLSQEDLASMFFVTRQTISSWENGKSYPDIETIIKISDKFNISLDKLLKGDKKMVKKIDKKVKLNKYLIWTLIALIIISIPVGVYIYKKACEGEANNVIGQMPEGYTAVGIDLENIVIKDDLKVGEYFDYYVDIKDADYDKNIPLYKGIEIKLIRDENNQNIETTENAKQIIAFIPDEEFKILMIARALDSENTKIEIRKSENESLIINEEIKNTIMNEAVNVSSE